ncbi:hypothetical protein TNCV_1665691 [Trichonephila clavipes]|nr:hypothetical protein TNCV_1665691 [Trichonephila clavipes]
MVSKLLKFKLHWRGLLPLQGVFSVLLGLELMTRRPRVRDRNHQVTVATPFLEVLHLNYSRAFGDGPRHSEPWSSKRCFFSGTRLEVSHVTLTPKLPLTLGQHGLEQVEANQNVNRTTKPAPQINTPA